MTETWAAIPGFPGYEVRPGADGGAVRNAAGQELALFSRNGYLRVLLRRNGKPCAASVHRLILTAFVRSPNPGEVGRHLDDDRTNNVLDNLAWGTRSDNAQDSKRNGTFPIGTRNGVAVGDDATVAEARAAYARGGVTIKALAKEHGVGVTTMRRWLTGECFSSAGGEIGLKPKGDTVARR